MNSKLLDFVNVSLRIKPNLKDVSSSLEIINNDPPILLVNDKSQIYNFDNIFTAEVNQTHVYMETVKPLVNHVKNGYNCTVFAYGQTGTGKTYTMGTNPDIKNEEDKGLIPRTLEDLFCLTNDDEEIEMYISFMEIYNEKVFDLLSTNKVPLSIKGFTVQGFEKIRIYEIRDALFHLTFGGKNRHTGETKQNFSSSRSHAIFTIHYHWKNSEKEVAAKLNLVDLAGSESVRKTGNQGSSLNEGININKGLLSLGQVMTALSNNSTHVPYRQSVVTTILQDSLNKKNYVSLIACVSSNTDDLGETLQTLEFSQRVKKIKNRPEINNIITQYKKENFLLANPMLRSSTPLKRSNDLMYETPFKKPKNYMPVITEPVASINNCDLDSSKFSFSSACGNIQPNFSPVIKKYLSEMENSLLTKFEDVIKNTLRRSTRRKLYNKENTSSPSTPSFPWDKISKMIRSEVVQFTDQISRVTSSPIEKCSKVEDVVTDSNNKRLLMDDLSSSSFHEVDSKKSTDELLFKKPEPVQKRKTKQFIDSPVQRRRSVRLQTKKQEDNTQRRRSVRLQKKSGSDQKINDVQLELKKRKIIRRNTKFPNELENGNDETNPFAIRTKQVLNTLNNGNIRDIATLHTVGIKTAEKILLFRQLNGRFVSISNLSKMPHWTKNKYQKFLAENFLNDDC